MENVIDNVLLVKVGTNTLTEKCRDGSERLDIRSFARISKQIINLQKGGMNIAIISSAAITAGMVATGLKKRPSKEQDMVNLQRLASIGWRPVLNAWDRELQTLTVGELLLTHAELDLNSERSEVLQVTHELMKQGDIVIANENDAISHIEIAFGDNDKLAATFAAKIGQSALFGSNIRLVLLSDIDGVYADINDRNSVINTIYDIDAYDHCVRDTDKEGGTGGMLTKFDAARIAMSAGVEMWIANGRTENAIARALSGEIGTRFALT